MTFKAETPNKSTHPLTSPQPQTEKNMQIPGLNKLQKVLIVQKAEKNSSCSFRNFPFYAQDLITI